MVYEWLLSDEYDVCDHMLYLFLYLDCKELCGIVATICWFMWRWLMMYICENYMLIELWMLLVIVYMLNWWWIVDDCIYTSIGDGEVIIVCVNICICSWVICSCIHDWWWWIIYPMEVITMFLLHQRWRPWGVLVPHASRWV